MILSGFVFDLAIKFGVIQPWTDLESGSSTSTTNTVGGSTYTSVPGGARAEAERRRAMALEALDRRMANPKAAAVGPSPSATPEPGMDMNKPRVGEEGDIGSSGGAGEGSSADKV